MIPSWRERKKRERAERASVIPALERLQAECFEKGDSAGARYVSDMILYATIGKDRKKLGCEYVERTREQVRKMQQMAEVLRGDLAG